MSSANRISSSKSVPAPQYTVQEEGGALECSPGTCASVCSGCLMFLISLIAVASLGVIAGGAFWTATAMHRVTDGNKEAVASRLCICTPPGTSHVAAGMPIGVVPVTTHITDTSKFKQSAETLFADIDSSTKAIQAAHVITARLAARAGRGNDLYSADASILSADSKLALGGPNNLGSIAVFACPATHCDGI